VSPATIAKRLLDEAGRTGGIVHTRSGPWSLGFSFKHKPSPVNIFSAKVIGAKPTEDDWNFLHVVATGVGAPPGSMQQPTGPNGTNYWIWP